MTERLDMQHIRKVILEIVQKYSNSSSLQTSLVLQTAIYDLGLKRDHDIEQSMLTIWHDLFRTGYLAWGFDISNPNPPFCHVTDQGRKMLQNLTRDPANPSGYLTFLNSRVSLNQVARSYLDEALSTYNSDCYKASAVMIGVASESMIIELRDVLSGRLSDLNLSPCRELRDWRLHQILEGINKELSIYKKNMSQKQKELFEQYWPAFIGLIRNVRNEAGHPLDIEPVTHESVQASLLVFPELSFLVSDLIKWIQSNDFINKQN